MKNAEKYREEYFDIKNRLKEIQNDISNLFEKHRNPDTGDNDFYSEYRDLIEYVKVWDYEDSLRKGKIKITDIIELKYPEDIEKIHSLFLEKKRLKWRLWQIKGIVLRNFLYR